MYKRQIRLIERETGIERALLTEELLDGRIAGLHSEIDHLLVRSDGTSVPVSWVASPVRDDSETQGVVLASVSYTHLDVYKRQIQCRPRTSTT